MKWLNLIPIFVFAGCSDVQSSFTVIDDGATIQSAQLELCGTITPLARHDGRLTVNKRINCEGSGYIRLFEVGGGERLCPVGYVTPGLEQHLTYEADECAKSA